MPITWKKKIFRIIKLQVHLSDLLEAAGGFWPGRGFWSSPNKKFSTLPGIAIA